uniref:ATP-binding cassette domain-containing protein n=1 Tax=Candidatus Methanarcanum hacksteinii TaxID=2911857 RepID=UPI0037DC13AA
MDPNNAIEIKNLKKTFTIEIADEGANHGIFNKHPTKKVQNIVLDDISLNIKKGEVIGILGRNGSGKSTLLSIIARIMEPDSGSIECSGKVASILELGMGFHQDMSGKENIYLKGELYGFSRKDIDGMLNSIINYSGIGKYIDAPVRTYSSGMNGRLAFAIMVHVNSDIMLVDEVLSTGDSAFAEKSKMHFKKLASSGKTVMVVSHDTTLIEECCTRVIWIENGKILRDGPSKKICSEYKIKMSESPDIVSDLAEEGVADAQYKLALMYRDGKNFEQSSELYKEWVKCAAEQGHTQAQVDYADILIKSGNRDDAITYYQSAANKGHLDARNKVATLNQTSDFDRQEILDIYEKISIPGDCLNEFRYADLILKTAWDNDDRKKAFDIFIKAAEDGYPNALHQIAIMYRDGIGTPRDLNKMEEWLTRASEMGFIPSMMMLADSYSTGNILPKDDEKAFKWYLKASELGNGECMYKLATMYKNGIGVEKNQLKANTWFKKYLHSGLFWHQIWAADYIRSNAIQTESTAYSLYKKASEMNNPVALGNLNTCQIANGDSVEETIQSLKMQTEAWNLDAIRRLANIYYDGIGVKRDYAEALKLYTKAAKLGDPWCKMRVGEMHRDGKGTPIDYLKAIEYFMDSAKSGNANSANNVILLYASGIFTDVNLMKECLDLLQNMGSGGNIDAIRRLANIYYDGIGVKRDYAEALKLYTKAAKLGDPWCKMRV